jgi:hypothetical protein
MMVGILGALIQVRFERVIGSVCFKPSSEDFVWDEGSLMKVWS